MSSAPFNSTVAYFSMEIALDKAIPTYSGGLGVLAGDTLRSAADLSRADRRRHAAAPKGLLRAASRRERQSDREARRVASRGPARAGRRAHDRHHRRTHCPHPRVEVSGARRQGPRSSRLSARHAARRERGVGSHAHRLPLRRRQPLSPAARRSCSAWAAPRCCARSTVRRSSTI